MLARKPKSSAEATEAADLHYEIVRQLRKDGYAPVRMMQVNHVKKVEQNNIVDSQMSTAEKLSQRGHLTT